MTRPDRQHMKSTQPGYFEVQHTRAPNGFAWLHFNCPCGCGDVGTLPLVRNAADKQSTHDWGWDGD